MDPGTLPTGNPAKDEAVPREERTWIYSAGRPEPGGFWVRLFGELDLHDLDTLGTLVRAVEDSSQPVLVDLSGVTFLDLGWARELAALHLLGPDHLVLCSPSWQASVSFAACGFAGPIEFRARVTGTEESEPY